jgi:hypothetical protein
MQEVAIGSIATIIGVWLGSFVLEAAVRAAGRGLRPDTSEGVALIDRRRSGKR